MIRDIVKNNELISPNSKEINALKEYFSSCFDGDSFDLEIFKSLIKDKVKISEEGYELKFLGKNYSKLIASTDTTTVVVPDDEHNDKPENKDSRNIYISGDNLDGLKHLKNSYGGKIKCIYIDPPYNTGSDNFIYKDNFNFSPGELSERLSIDEEQAKRIINFTKKGSASHSAWLMFMYPRLMLARELLADDGVILISIDENEFANCKLICDDIFLEENFIDAIIWEKKSSAKGVPPKNMMVNVHEYVLAYQRRDGFRFVGKERDEKGFKNPDNDPRGPWRESNLKSTTQSADKAFAIRDPETGREYTNTWAFSKESIEKMISEGRILWKKTLPKQKEYLREMTNETMALKSSWGVFDPQSTTVYLKEIMPEVHFDNPKPIDFMKYLLSVSSGKDDIILDFFGGSATTAHAVMELNAEDPLSNRKFILVQIQASVEKGNLSHNEMYNTIDKIGYQRIIRSAAYLKDKYPDSAADFGFKHYSLEEVSDNTLDKLEKFELDLQESFLSNGILSEFGMKTVLATWLLRDGYGLNADVEAVDFDGYRGYYIENHLYLIDEGISEKAISSIVEKYETDGKFNPGNIVLFGYSFSFSKQDVLKTNLTRLRNTVNFDIRY